jgi:hypothetical protein
VRPGISEFSFGYALTERLVVAEGVTAAPTFPSLIQEGQAGGGWDLSLPTPGMVMFLQFKLSDYMKTARASERKSGDFAAPFYRMHLRPKKISDQHDLLLELETTEPEVYYAAPLFHTTAELNQHYLQDTIVANTRFIRPTDIGALPDDDAHHVAFDGQGGPLVMSSPVPRRLRGSALSWHGLLDRARTPVSSGQRVVNRERLTHLAGEMWNILERHDVGRTRTAGFRPGVLGAERGPIVELDYVARVFFECQPILLRFPGGDQPQE